VLGKISMGGSDESIGDMLGELAGFDDFSFTVGANFEYPLGNRAAKSSYNQTKLKIDQSKLSLHNLEQLLTVQVRQAVRGVETAYELVNATQIAQELAQEQLDAEQKKFNEGLSTNFQVLNYQEQLASAKSRHTQALTGYNQALVALEQITGNTLHNHNIVIQE
jgi:outer membrane protein TolC